VGWVLRRVLDQPRGRAQHRVLGHMREEQLAGVLVGALAELGGEVEGEGAGVEQLAGDGSLQEQCQFGS
jgi:hypothetical protein